MIGVNVWSLAQGETDSFYSSQRPNDRNRQTESEGMRESWKPVKGELFWLS